MSGMNRTSKLTFSNSGHVFPGANLPYGMAKPVADVNTEIQGGFASDDGDSAYTMTLVPMLRC